MTFSYDLDVWPFEGRSLMPKKNGGIKESSDSSTTIEDEDTRGELKVVTLNLWAVVMT